LLIGRSWCYCLREAAFPLSHNLNWEVPLTGRSVPDDGETDS
jgi:hypothetical protein